MRSHRKPSLRRAWLDVVIGWNQGAAEKYELKAAAHRRREATARSEYRRRFVTRWP